MSLSSIGCCIFFFNFSLTSGLLSSANGIHYYTENFLAVAVVMQLLILLLKSATQDAIYTSLIGMFYGPVFPAALGMANDILPGEVHMVAMALM